MTLTTTPTVEGKTVQEYKGIVFGGVVSGVNFIKDFAVGADNGMLMVTVSGTAVTCG